MYMNLGNFKQSKVIGGFVSARNTVSVKRDLSLIYILYVRLRKISFKAFVNIKPWEFVLHVIYSIQISWQLLEMALILKTFLFAWGFFSLLQWGPKGPERSHSLFSSSQLIRLKKTKTKQKTQENKQTNPNSSQNYFVFFRTTICLQLLLHVLWIMCQVCAWGTGFHIHIHFQI